MAVHGNKREDYLKPGEVEKPIPERPNPGPKVSFEDTGIGGNKMETGDFIGISGSLELIHKDKDGNIKDRVKYENLITYEGLTQVAKLVAGLATAPFKYIYIGTGAQDPANPGQILPPDPSDHSLRTIYQYGLAVTSYSQVTNSTERGFQAIARFAYTFDFTEEVGINEAGIFTGDPSVSDAVMLSEKTFYDRVMFATDFLEAVWEISLTRYPKDKIT